MLDGPYLLVSKMLVLVTGSESFEVRINSPLNSVIYGSPARSEVTLIPRWPDSDPTE